MMHDLDCRIGFAQLARTAQQACGGRFTLGVGPSHQIVVESMYGEQWDRPLESTREYLSALEAHRRATRNGLEVWLS